MVVAEVCSLMMTDGGTGAWGQDDPVPLRSKGVVGGHASMTKKRAEGFQGLPDGDGMARKSLIRPTGDPVNGSNATMLCGRAALQPRYF